MPKLQCLTSSLDRFVVRLAQSVQAWAATPMPARRAILRWLGVEIGSGVIIFHSTLFGSGKYSLGDGTFIGVNCLFEGSEGITIGHRVAVASGVQLITSTHAIGPPSQRAGAHQNAPIVVGDGCWLGASCMVLPGVTIASGCIIAAAALVSKDTEPNGLYVGIPARRVRDLPVCQGQA